MANIDRRNKTIDGCGFVSGSTEIGQSILSTNIDTPEQKVFELLRSGIPTGVDALPIELTIDGQSVLPSFRYKGGDANVTNWVAWTHGATLTKSAGTAPTYNRGSPLLGSNDDSVRFNLGAYYQAAAAATGDIAAEDWVLETIIKMSPTANGRYLSKHGTAGNAAGWDFYSSGSVLRLTPGNGAASVLIQSAALTVDTWNHVMVFYDASGSAQIYINGVASGSAVAVSTLGSLTNATLLTAGANTAGTNPNDGNIAYAALYKQSAWLSTHLQATAAKTRFCQLLGLCPQVKKGTCLPATIARNTPAYLDKLNGDDRNLYYVGTNWIRTVCRPDSDFSESLTGLLIEPNITNRLWQSGDFTATWTKANAGDTVTADALLTVNKKIVADSILANSDDAEHGVRQTALITASQYMFSVFAKAGVNNWLYLEDNTVANAYAYFDLDNGVVGTVGAGCTSTTIQDWGDGWFRCGIEFAGSAANHDFYIETTEADNDKTFVGAGVVPHLYIWGAQAEAGNYMTSYIPSLAGTAARNADNLMYKGDDGNLGGVGSAKQGTIECKILRSSLDLVTSNATICTLSDGASVDNSITMSVNPTGDCLDCTGKVDTTTKWSIAAGSPNPDISDRNIHTVKHSWKVGEQKRWVDGVKLGTDGTGNDVPNDLDQIHIGQNATSALQFGGVISQLTIYRKVRD